VARARHYEQVATPRRSQFRKVAGVVLLSVLAAVAVGWWLNQRTLRHGDAVAYTQLRRDPVLALQPPAYRLVSRESFGPCKGDSGGGSFVGDSYASVGEPTNPLAYLRTTVGRFGWSGVEVRGDRLLASKLVNGRKTVLEVSTQAYAGTNLHVDLRFTPRQRCGLL
jgi:hypothetical protein